MRVTLVHNPTSGDDDHTGERLVELLKRHEHEVRYMRSKGREWRQALKEPSDLVAIAGGDGTVTKVATAIAGTGIPLTILPTGTANNIAGWLGLTGIPHEELVAGWRSASVQPFDIGTAVGPWGTRQFLESVGVGVLAGMIAEVDTGASGFVNQLERREDCRQQHDAGVHGFAAHGRGCRRFGACVCRY